MYNDFYNEKLNEFKEMMKKGEVYKAGGKGCRLGGDLTEIAFTCEYGKDKIEIKSAGKIDLLTHKVTIEIKTGNGQIANLYQDGIIKDINKGMYIAYLFRFNPDKDIKKQIRIIKYDDFVNFLMSNDLLVRNYNSEKQRERQNNGLKRFYDRLNLRVNKVFNDEDLYNEFIKMSMNFYEFNEYLNNRKKGQDVINYRKLKNDIQEYILDKWESFDLP
jgi:hypothetical protein